MYRHSRDTYAEVKGCLIWIDKEATNRSKRRAMCGRSNADSGGDGILDMFARRDIVDELTGLLSDTFCLSFEVQTLMLRQDVATNNTVYGFISHHSESLIFASRDIAKKINQINTGVIITHEHLRKYSSLDNIEDDISILDILLFLKSSNTRIETNAYDILNNHSDFISDDLRALLYERYEAHKSAQKTLSHILGVEVNLWI